MAFKIHSELSEKQVEADIASYLGFLTPIWSRKRFRLITVDEQATGADKKFDRFIPLFLQFKVAQGLNPKANILKRFSNKPLSKIISFRKKNQLNGNPILYFELRRKAPTAIEFQHNLLRRMHNPPFQYGLYIAPLTLKMDQYEKMLNVDWLTKFYLTDPFIVRYSNLFDATVLRNIALGRNLFLRHHISIPPHLEITTHKHHYSFSINGADIAWHGGQLMKEDYRLSTLLERIYQTLLEHKHIGYNLEEFIEEITRSPVKGFTSDASTNTKEGQLIYIRHLMGFLKNEYDIALMLLEDIGSSN